MKNKNDKRIACVMLPTTQGMSALARSRKLTPIEEWLFRIADPIVFSEYTALWMELWGAYLHAEGFFWLFFRLPFRLIKGKYSLFMAAARDPQAIITFVISRLLRKPVIISDTFYMWSGSMRARLFWPFSRFVCSQATFLAVPSTRVMNFWKSAGIHAKRIRLTNAFMSTIEINEKNLAKAKELKKELGYKKIVLFIGRLIEGKGLEYLIRAFARFSEVRNMGLLIVGDGPERNRFERLCKELKLSNVAFIGFVNREEIASYHLLSDILVAPSVTLRCHDEWGLVVNEAMSVAKPVVVSDSVGCARELVKSGVNGYVVPEKNAEALYEAIKRLMTNDELRIRMGKESERIIAHGFTYAHAIRNIRKMLKDALQRAC